MGYDLGVSTRRVAEEGADLMGRRLAMSAEVERTLGPRAFLLGDDELLVISPFALAGVVAEATANLTATVRPWRRGTPGAGLPPDLADDVREGYDHEVVLVLDGLSLIT